MGALNGIDGFREFIGSLGLDPPTRIEPGQIVRIDTKGKANNRNGSAKLWPDCEGGWVHDWTTGEHFDWQAKRDRPLTDSERRAWIDRCERAKREAHAEREREAKQTAERARAIWEAARPADDSHPYLMAKGVKCHGLRIYRGAIALGGKRCDGALVLPSRNAGGDLVSLQFLTPEAEKLYLNGPRPPGAYFAIGKPEGTLCIAEGYATAASIHEATGYAVAVAFDAGNLEATAKALRAKVPDVCVILCADNDVKPEGGNRGVEAATAAARAIGGLLAVPEMAGAKCDFNDLATKEGAEAVQRAMANARAAEVRTHQATAPNAAIATVSGGDVPRIIALEIAELLTRDFPPKDPFLAPWLRKQDLVMVYSKRGVGKTQFCLDLAYAVASGAPFLHWTAPKPRRVLYIDGEMPGVSMKERLAALAASQDAEPPEGYFRIVTPDVQAFPLPDLATVDGQLELAPVIGDAELIVLDNLSSLMRAGVENEGEAWVPMANWALAQRREGRSVLFVHHAGKGGQQRGSSRREDLLDVVIQLKHPSDYNAEQGARFEIAFEKARGLMGKDVQSIEAQLTQGPDGRTWATKEIEGERANRIAEMSKLGMSAAEIAAELGIHRSNVYRALDKGGGNGR